VDSMGRRIPASDSRTDYGKRARLGVRAVEALAQTQAFTHMESVRRD